MSTAAMTAPDGYPWREHLFGDAVAARQSVLVLASYPILLVLVILSAFVRYMWVAPAMYCVFLFVISCTACAYVDRRHAAAARPSLGGLSAGAIAAVAPAFAYDAAAGGGGEAECAVCLEAVRDGEKARRLPACAHTFHVACIDMWLDSHGTCPVCRCYVLPQKAGKELLSQSPAQGPAVEPLPPV